MAHFAQIDENNTVVQVIVAEQDFIDSLPDANSWIQTSYNTRSGEHIQGGIPLRKNYAGIGFSYDSDRDAFIPPKVYASWLLDEYTCTWIPPIPVPNDGNKYRWDENTISWIMYESPSDN